VLLLLTGVGHVLTELLSDGLRGASETLDRPQHAFNLAVALAWGAYLLWRLIATKGAARAWGLTRCGFGLALRDASLLAAVGLVPLLAYGWAQGRLPPPATLWLVMGLYPVWGLGQQFGLQALITRNLRALLPQAGARVPVAAVLFSVAHFPNFVLMGLTFAAGLGFTWVYERHRNLWALGIVHGVLGALAYYLVLGQDPGVEIMGMLKGLR